MDDKSHRQQLKQRQTQLVHFQQWVRDTQQKVVILLEGRDGAGKSSMIRTITQHLNPRFYRVVALDKPTPREQSQWYFQRYLKHLPASGEIVLFDRSWYNRAGVESVMNFCSQEQLEQFLQTVLLLEHSLVNEGLKLHKYFLSISHQEQAKRFERRLKHPRKNWKFSQMDVVSRQRWNDYSEAYSRMFQNTHSTVAPWTVIESDHKPFSRLTLIDHFLRQYEFPKQPACDAHQITKLATDSLQNIHYGPADVLSDND
ncbi:Polyphosphate kinase [Saliniradius amylolyticus]|uniref:ADP/GDP-polyphosphate phosphotransferase n=1 Tax=Saliniradius amylolyticus TaxID=2183582 RepID=A0A2S2E147_9ALTE|nr:polyphosphate kinase 2 [Saliniradius amylolyticus]AWL11371.1 Polyphosphate kinase [Saliniradius amylolyticus]